MKTRPLAIRRVASDEDASFLMPGQGGDMTLVIFCGAQAPVIERARAVAAEVVFPAHWSIAVIDPDSAAKTARWFGIKDVPAMGAVCDGALLDVEYECTTDAFERLVRIAKQQYSNL
jgi:hypothetical protein